MAFSNGGVMIEDAPSLLSRLTRLKVSNNSPDPAPHKPLLLLAVMDLFQSGLLTSNPIPRSAELTFQFMTYSRVVAHRRNALDVRMPFHHLGGDGVWEPLDGSLQRSPDKKLTRFARCSGGVFAAFSDQTFRDQARRILIARWFTPSEQLALAAILGIPEAELGEEAAAVAPVDRNNAVNRGRDVKFRLVVVAGYAFTCCLTRHRLTTISRGSLVDAAHIHQFADSRNNDPRNGIALSKNAHWMFDQGLWTITDDLTVKVAHGHFTEDCPHGEGLAKFDGQPLLVPIDPRLRPDPAHLSWHRQKKFLGGEQA
jgi:putative restriction endonuclease